MYRLVHQQPLNAAHVAVWHLLFAAPGRHGFNGMLPKPHVLPILLRASLLGVSWLNLLRIRLLLPPCWWSFLKLGYSNLQFSAVQAR